jgi:hypothetical protein
MVRINPDMIKKPDNDDVSSNKSTNPDNVNQNNATNVNQNNATNYVAHYNTEGEENEEINEAGLWLINKSQLSISQTRRTKKVYTSSFNNAKTETPDFMNPMLMGFYGEKGYKNNVKKAKKYNKQLTIQELKVEAVIQRARKKLIRP